jgi:hypothetical protein
MSSDITHDMQLVNSLLNNDLELREKMVAAQRIEHYDVFFNLLRERRDLYLKAAHRCKTVMYKTLMTTISLSTQNEITMHTNQREFNDQFAAVISQIERIEERLKKLENGN